MTSRAGKKYVSIEECEIEVPGPFCLVIFGASGDLATRKIMPSLYRLSRDKLLPKDFCVLGASRTEMDHNGFRELILGSLKEAFPEKFDRNLWESFAEKLYYTSFRYDERDAYGSLRETILALEKKHGTMESRIFYLALPPDVYEPVIQNLGEAGLSAEDNGYTHIVIEKPIGHDLESARKLNAILGSYFRERQIYRMDHYLAKETVQNILIFRFANSIFEPLWNRRYIDHVQITVSETLGVEQRAGYYDRAGVVRDMFQNHIFQLLALTAMEPPSQFEAERVRDEKVKVFRSIRPFPLDRLHDFVVTGQYGEGIVEVEEVAGYRGEAGVPPDSITPTYAAMKIHIDNWRWNGVPFYLRSGKRLAKRRAEISIHYREVPHLMFAKTLEERIEPDTLVMRVQPDEGISIIFQAKTQGTKVCLQPVTMDYSYPKVVSLSDYERILLDCMQGDQMLFVREDAVEESWALLSPVLKKLESEAGPEKFPNYAAGSAGPVEADKLLQKDGRAWRPL